jgi:hypothetical protein
MRIYRAGGVGLVWVRHLEKHGAIFFLESLEGLYDTDPRIDNVSTCWLSEWERAVKPCTGSAGLQNQIQNSENVERRVRTK